MSNLSDDYRMLDKSTIKKNLKKFKENDDNTYIWKQYFSHYYPEIKSDIDNNFKSRIPYPNNETNCMQLVLGPIEYILPYYLNSEKYSILSMNNDKWSWDYNKLYVLGGLKKFLRDKFSSQKFCKYPIRLVLPCRLSKINKYEKLNNRVTQAELYIIYQLTKNSNIKAVRIKGFKNPYIYLLKDLD